MLGLFFQEFFIAALPRTLEAQQRPVVFLIKRPSFPRLNLFNKNMVLLKAL